MASKKPKPSLLDRVLARPSFPVGPSLADRVRAREEREATARYRETMVRLTALLVGGPQGPARRAGTHLADDWRQRLDEAAPAARDAVLALVDHVHRAGLDAVDVRELAGAIGPGHDGMTWDELRPRVLRVDAIAAKLIERRPGRGTQPPDGRLGRRFVDETGNECRMEWKADLGEWRPPPKALPELSPVAAAILACLRRNCGRDVEAQDLRTAAGLHHGKNDKRAQQRACKELARRNLAQKGRRGYWRSLEVA